MEDVGMVMSWFSSPVYNQYWDHYKQSMAWHQKHRRAFRKGWGAFDRGHGHYTKSQSSSARLYADWETKESDEDDDEDDEEDEESSSDSDIECDLSNMKISEELREYFAQTETHREELKKQQQQMEKEQHVPADQDLHAASWWSSAAPPSERPGERRTAEMKKLYGKDAAKIQAMEAAMQLTFDRNRDLYRPVYWPVIPLKL